MKTKVRIFAFMIPLSITLLAACSGETPTAIPTNPTVPTSPVVETASGSEAELSGPEALRTQPWMWVTFTDPLQQFEVEAPENYQLTFNNDGTLNILADCNNAIASFTADESRLTIEIGSMTMAACPPTSRSDQFVGLLGNAAIYFFQDGGMFIDLFADGGTMEFAPTSK